MRDHPDLFILRHGQTEWNVALRYQGHGDSPLTPLGRAQAQAQQRLLAELPDLPQHAFVSPLGRALETARIALAGREPAIIDSRLKEVGFGDWEGLTRDDIASRPDCPTGIGPWYFQSPGGETFDAIHARVSDFLNDLPGPAIVVTHGLTSRIMRGLCMGLGQSAMLDLPIPQGCIFQLRDGREKILEEYTPE